MSELFDARERAAWGGFIATWSHLFRRIEDDLRENFGLSHPEFEVLLRLARAREGRARIQDLAARSLLTRSGTSRLIDRLVRAGYVERRDAEEDGRGAYAVLTEAGRRHFHAAARAHTALVRAAFLDHFSPEELDILAGYWERLGAG